MKVGDVVCMSLEGEESFHLILGEHRSSQGSIFLVSEGETEWFYTNSRFLTVVEPHYSEPSYVELAWRMRRAFMEQNPYELKPEAK